MKLISQWWIPEDESRLAELEFCKKKNQEVFDEQVYLDGSSGSLTFKQLFSEARDGELVVVANTDVWFDESIAILERLVQGNAFAALTKWDVDSSPNMTGWTLSVPQNNVLFFSGTQDAWAFIGSKKMRAAPEIPLGVTACDQSIAAWAVIQKMFVINPALSVKFWHEHSIRRDPKDVWIKGWYCYPQLTTEDVTGVVAAHEWTQNAEMDWKVIQCQRSH